MNWLFPSRRITLFFLRFHWNYEAEPPTAKHFTQNSFLFTEIDSWKSKLDLNENGEEIILWNIRKPKLINAHVFKFACDWNTCFEFVFFINSEVSMSTWTVRHQTFELHRDSHEDVCSMQIFAWPNVVRVMRLTVEDA